MVAVPSLSSLRYVLAPEGWGPEEPNPFSSDGAYGEAWSGLVVTQTEDAFNYPGTCRSRRGLYRLFLGVGHSEYSTSLRDCLAYESEHGRTVIVTHPAPENFDSTLGRCTATHPDPREVRATDPRWGVHSTPLDRWASIRACGELRSLSRLGREGFAVPEIGRGQRLGEPDDFRDYVMFGSVDGIAAEIVVASHERGYVFDTNEAFDSPYTPGVRLYLDIHRIVRDGLAVRDGIHRAKVHDSLPLEPYLKAVIGVGDADPDGRVDGWTPRLFTEKSSQAFRRLIAE